MVAFRYNNNNVSHCTSIGSNSNIWLRLRMTGCLVAFVVIFLLQLQTSFAWITTTTTTTTLSSSSTMTQKLSSLPSSSSSFGKRSGTVVLQASNGKEESSSYDSMGLNELQTLLRDAVQRENFAEAGKLSDELLTRLYDYSDNAISAEERRQRRKRMSWKGLGAAPWLIDRLDALNYTFPTTIQINSMESVNAILNTTSGSDLVESTSLEERIDRDMGIVVSGTTGSGKTLAYLVPLLSTMSDSLFTRQRLRVSDEESVGDTMGDLVQRVAMVTSPVIRSRSRKQILKNDAPTLTGASLSTLGKSGRDVKTPLALIVVPGKELGVQIAMLCYQLIGGNLKNSATEYSPGAKTNMFKYKGPKGVRIACVLDDEEASFGLKLQTDVAITTPEYLGKLIKDGEIVPSKLRVVIYDEADLGLERTSRKNLSRLFDDDPEQRDYSRLTFLVGASVTESLGNLAVRSRVLPDGKSYIATATRYSSLSNNHDNDSQDGKTNGVDDDSSSTTTNGSNNNDNNNALSESGKSASLQDLDVCLCPGLKHERVVLPEGSNDSGLLVLTQLLRKELRDYEEQAQAAIRAGKMNGATKQRPRVVVFFPDEIQAKAAIEPLRDALWGEHMLCVLLPKTGVAPLDIMEQFKNSETSTMLATPNSVRGLDFPALTHVYTLYLPMDDPREYVHLAGRVGRIGQMGSAKGDGGHVVSILKHDEAYKMNELANNLGFDFTDVPPGYYNNYNKDNLPRNDDGNVDYDAVTDNEQLRRYLEDTISLVGLADDPEVLVSSSSRAEETIIDVDSNVGSSSSSANDDGDNQENNSNNGDDDEDDEEEQPYQ